MSCGSVHVFASPIGNVEDVQNRSMPEPIATSRSPSSVGTPEGVHTLLDREGERLRSESKSFRDEFARLNLEKLRLEEELRKCRASVGECVVAYRPGIAEDVYSILMEKVRRGGGETSLKEIFDELLRKIDGLEGEKRAWESERRLWVKKHKELNQRVLQLERDISVRENEHQCISGNREGVSAVLREPDDIINVDAFGDCGSILRGSDSKRGGSVCLAYNACKTGACLSPIVGSSRKSLVKVGGVLSGDGSIPLVELIESDDDCGGPSEQLSGDKYHSGRNDKKGEKELKRKRGSFPSVLDEPFTQTLRGVAAALKQCEQKNNKEKDPDNSLSKSTGVNSIKHKIGTGSVSAKSSDGSSSLKEGWKCEANLLFDFIRDDVLCLKAVCALYRCQRSKSMEWTASQGFNGLLSPKEYSLAEFLTGGDPEGKLKKSVADLRGHNPNGMDVCRCIAVDRFKQLFVMFQKKEDPFFPSS